MQPQRLIQIGLELQKASSTGGEAENCTHLASLVFADKMEMPISQRSSPQVIRINDSETLTVPAVFPTESLKDKKSHDLAIVASYNVQTMRSPDFFSWRLNYEILNWIYYKYWT